MIEIWTLLSQIINIPAALAGAAVTLAVMYLLPAPEGSKWFEVKAGTWYGRLVPFVAPVVAITLCTVTEWDGRYSANDVVRGILSGWGSEFILRFYFKSVVAV